MIFIISTSLLVSCCTGQTAVICSELFSLKSLGELSKAPHTLENFQMLQAHLEASAYDWTIQGYVTTIAREYLNTPELSDHAAKLILKLRQINPGAKDYYSRYYGDEQYDMSEETLLLHLLSASRSEREALGGVRRKVLKTPSGDFDLKVQPELERRVQLPSSLFVAKLKPISQYIFPYPREMNINETSDIVEALLWRYSSATKYLYDNSLLPLLSFRPLGSESEHFHSGQFQSAHKAGNENAFTRKIHDRIPIKGERDDVTQSYIVTYQREIGTYYDTQQGDLWRQRIIIRTKEFRSMKETGVEEHTLILFAKKTQSQDQNGFFTHREEFEVKLPIGASTKQIRDAKIALLAELGVDPNLIDQLVVIETINNERYGFDLVWRQLIKIGFITVDSFRSANADAIDPSTPPFRQWEIELLPEYVFLKDKFPKVFASFFAELERSFMGEINTVPKAHQYREQ